MTLIKSAVAADSAQYWPLSAAMMVVTPIILLLLGWALRRFFCQWDRSYQLLTREVADRSSWPDLIKRYSGSGSERYFDTVAALSRFADRLYGDRLFSRQAFNMSLRLAFLYPILAVVLFWWWSN